MRLQFDVAEGRLLPVTAVLATALLHAPFMHHPALYILHHDIRQQRAHLTVGLPEVPEEGDNLAGDVVPVDVIVGVPVGSTDMKGGDEVVEVVVNTIQVTIVCCVDQNCWPCQGIVKSIIGKLLCEICQKIRSENYLSSPPERMGERGSRARQHRTKSPDRRQ